jgi:SAM-dependent methyltransferase
VELLPNSGDVSTQNPYESLYCAVRDGLLWGSEPGRLVSQIMRWGRLGTVLDVGCGDGKNSLFLESVGFRVVGIDVSEAAIAGLKRRAKLMQRNLTGRYVVGDATTLPFRGTFDFIVSYGIYHAISPSTRMHFHQGLLRLLRPGGYILFTCLTDQLAVPPQHFGMEVVLPSLCEVRGLFTEERLAVWQTGMIRESHLPTIGEHQHSAVWLVAEKSSGL